MRTTLNVNPVFIATVRAAHPDKDAASEILNLRQDGSPSGQRQLAGSVHDSRVPTGTTPGSVFILSFIRDKSRKRYTAEYRKRCNRDE